MAEQDSYKVQISVIPAEKAHDLSDRILYVYLKHYRGVRNTEVCFDNRFKIHFDEDTNTIDILTRRNPLEGFWGKKIHSLTAIVGKNGCGKTTVLRYVLEAVVNGYQKNRMKIFW